MTANTTDYYTDSTEQSSSSASADYKYAQVAVPQHAIATPPVSFTSATTTTTTGNSFLRLGSFPITITGSTTSGFSMATATDAPDGFSASLTLAKIVGNMDSSSNADTVVSVETTDDSTSVSGDKVFTSEPFSHKTTSYLGFADDTRARDDATTSLALTGSTCANSTANRKAETSRLLSKGGWWDHADGNRISTTAGDKVEVIQGNYKMVVLGRRPSSPTSTATADAKVVDISGGYEFTKTYEYLTNEQVWATFEESTKKHATVKSSGKQASYFTGSLKYSEVGSSTGTSGTDNPDVVSKTWAQRVESRTWADKIETYVGTIDKRVSHIVLLTYADFMEDMRICMLDHITMRVAMTGSVVAVNVGTINNTVLNAAATSLFMNTAVFTADLRMGYVYMLGVSETHIYANTTTFKGSEQIVGLKKDELNMIRCEINAVENEIALDNKLIFGKLTQLTAAQMEISGNNTVLAGAHLFL